MGMKVLEPLDVKSLHLQNRLILLATHLNMCENGEVTQQLIDFYEERAKHGPGMIIVGGCFTEHLGMSAPTMIGISEERHEAGLKLLSETIHQYNVPVAAQLYHAGRYVYSFAIGQQAVSASEVPSPFTREIPRALSIEEIEQTINNFGNAAERAKRCGFDAVEIIGSAGYLINQFMARATNKRNDEYGGPLENRARFAIEVIQEVRARVGDDFPVLYRISGEDFVPDGMTLEDNKQVVPWLVDAGIDILNVTGGWHETRVPQITMDVPRGKYVYLAEGLATAVDIPVIACNRINSPTIAERILKKGKVQLIGMSRGFIADEMLVEKIKKGEFKRIRPCIGCNQGCLDHVFMLEPVTCAINPRAGFEKSRYINKQGEGKIAVVGAGVAGMEVSRVLSLRGFDVTLYEREAMPGGMLRLASRAPGRGEFLAYVTHMWNELKTLDVDLEFNTRATAKLLASESYDLVICANGTIPSIPAIQGLELPHVISAIEVLSNQHANLGRVTVIGGGLIGCHVALYLANHVKSVVIVEKDKRIGSDIGRSTRWVILKMLKEHGVEFITEAEIDQITNDYVFVKVNDEDKLIRTDAVVVASWPMPDERLFAELRNNGTRVEKVGSVAGQKNILEIIHNAFEFANSLTLK